MTEFDFSEGYALLDAAMTPGSEGSDRIPFIAQMHEFAMRQSGRSGREFYTDPEVFVRGVLETARDFGFDTPSFIWDVYNIEAEALGARLVLFDDMAPAIDNVRPIIESEKDLARLTPPDPGRSGRMPFVFDVLHLVGEYTGRAPAPSYCAPFTLASHCMTFERLILAIKDDPAYVHKVMTFLTDEVLAPYCNAMTAAFPDATVIDGSDAIASLPFITQDMLEEFSLGYIERLQRQCSVPVICDNWWGDSFTTDRERFWGLKLRATPSYFKIQDPDLFKVGTDEPVAFARRMDKPIVLGVDNNVLQNGPAEEIEKRIHEYMEAGEPTRRCVLYLCSLSAETPPEHVRAAVAAIKRFRAGDRPHKGLHLSGRAEAVTAPVAPPTRGAGSSATHGADSDDPAREKFEERLDAIFDSIMDYDDEAVVSHVEHALTENIAVQEILDDALIAAMDDIGEMFSQGTIFVPEMLLAARAMKSGLAVVRPILIKSKTKPKGTVLLATVQGDVHDIGKNLVGMMLEGAGYTVVDLGVNVDREAIVARAEELKPDVVGLSALLTTSMPQMARTVETFRERGLPWPVVVGGAPVTEEFAEKIGADGYAGNAPEAVELVGRIVRAANQGQMAAG
jgi:5-methyltetrahydrofolate--homocysteine methyltransferase